MKGKGLGTCARQLVAEMETIKSMNLILPVRVAEDRVEMRLRTASKPDRMTPELLSHMGLQLPARSRTFANVVQKERCKYAQTVANQRMNFSN